MSKQFLGCLYLLFVNAIGYLSADECHLFCCQGKKVTFKQTCKKWLMTNSYYDCYTNEPMVISKFSGYLKPEYNSSNACFQEANKYSWDSWDIWNNHQFDNFQHTFEDCNFVVTELVIKTKKNMELRLNEIVATLTKLRYVKVIITSNDHNKWNFNLNSVSLHNTLIIYLS